MENVKFDFVGGPHHGKRLCSDSFNEVEAEYARRVGWIFGLPRVICETAPQEKDDFGAERPSTAEIIERGRREGWSHAQVQSTIGYCDYAVAQCRRVGGCVHVTASYRGV